MNKYDLEMDIEYDTQKFWEHMIDDYDGTIDLIDLKNIIIDCLRQL